MSMDTVRFRGRGRIYVKLLGGLQVRCGTVTLSARDLGGSRPRQVLEILALNRSMPVSKDRLIDMIWGEAAPAEALPTLESYVSVLRSRIQPGHTRTGPLKTVTAGYMLDGGQLELDLDHFKQRIQQARHAEPATAYPLLLQALAIADEPLLADEPSAGWAEVERQNHQVMLRWAQTTAARAAAAVGEFDDAVQLAQQALAADRLDESAWLALLDALRAAGRPAEALRGFEQCRQVFIEELGCVPGPTLQKIRQQLLEEAADTDAALSDLLSAVLCLHAHTAPGAAGIAGYPPGTALENAQPLREASRILDNLLKQAEAVLRPQQPA